MTVIGGHVWGAMSDADKAVFGEVLKRAVSNTTNQIRASEQELATKFRELGRTLVEVDRERFIEAVKPLHNDASVRATWDRSQYDTLQAL